MFTIIATILFVLLFLIWRRSNFLNLCIKGIFLGMSVWGAFLVLKDFGYLIKT